MFEWGIRGVCRTQRHNEEVKRGLIETNIEKNFVCPYEINPAENTK